MLKTQEAAKSQSHSSGDPPNSAGAAEQPQGIIPHLSTSIPDGFKRQRLPSGKVNI
jgi:hypothetical protein